MNTHPSAIFDTQALASAVDAHAQVVDGFLDDARGLANVVGLGVGGKWRGGQPVGEPSLLVLVTHKVDPSQLAARDRVPQELGGMQTDVVAIGYPMAGDSLSFDAGAQTLARRARPARGGVSVGHHKITAGTLGTAVYDILPGGTASPPSPGLGMPPRYYILSNNHVLANSNDARVGDAILQPGPYDGGVDPTDRIARLSRFVPITFEPGVPRSAHRNLVDAAVAEGEFHDLDREIFWIGPVAGWRPKASLRVGDVVQKTGRTTNYTTGRVVAINATIDVGYGGGRLARFVDQVVTTPMSAGGDSGSLITTLDNKAVGLLFAGSASSTIFNHIEHVRSLLRVEVAEEIG